MSKGGGAGKVYFVLYLAVVLELLIIIVERDEAEEGLLKKQKETMRIVESILSQLQSGSGTEGMNTRPQDEITIPPSGVDIKEVLGAEIKSFRKYTVDVGVTDVTGAIKRKEEETEKEYFQRLKTLVTLANVAEIEYQIFYNSSEDPNKAPPFLSDDEISKRKMDFAKFTAGEVIVNDDGDEWEFLALRKLVLDKDATFNGMDLANISVDAMHPVYPHEMEVAIGDDFKPADVPQDSTFYYSDIASHVASGGESSSGMQKRTFVVNFQPPSKAGWYKLRFSSRTNRILGVRANVDRNHIDEESTVNIGTVQLTVKALMKVRKTLESTLEKYQLPPADVLLEDNGLEKFDDQIKGAIKKIMGEDNAIELKGKMELYSYIAKLLTPGQSVYFKQNRGALEINVRVITPNPPTANPVIIVNNDIHRFDAIAPMFRVSISPYRPGGGNIITGFVYNKSDVAGVEPIAQISFVPVTEEEPPAGGSRAYYGEVDRILDAGPDGSPRMYMLKLTHNIAGAAKPGDTSAVLTIYPTIVEANVEELANRFDALASYGSYLNFNFMPPSGNKILSDQFCFKFKTDADVQDRGCQRGYSAKNSDGLYFGANASTASLEIVWKDPITDVEVPIFPLKEVSIKQSSPKIRVNNASSSIGGTTDRLKIRVTNIKIIYPNIGVENDPNKKANIDLNVEIKKVRVTQNYRAAGKPKVTIKDNMVTVEFDLVGEPDEDAWAKGTVELKLTAIATNPINKKQSRPATKTYKIKIRKKFEPIDTYYEE